MSKLGRLYTYFSNKPAVALDIALFLAAWKFGDLVMQAIIGVFFR
jgi:hypothetical protein